MMSSHHFLLALLIVPNAQPLDLYEAVQHRIGANTSCSAAHRGIQPGVAEVARNAHLEAARQLLRRGHPALAAAKCAVGLHAPNPPQQGELTLVLAIALLHQATAIVADLGWPEAQSYVQKAANQLQIARGMLQSQRAQTHAENCLLIAQYALNPSEELLDRVKGVWFKRQSDMQLAAPHKLVLLRTVSAEVMLRSAGWERNRLLIIRPLSSLSPLPLSRSHILSRRLSLSLFL